jgi:hypothetical protein
VITPVRSDKISGNNPCDFTNFKDNQCNLFQKTRLIHASSREECGWVTPEKKQNLRFKCFFKIFRGGRNTEKLADHTGPAESEISEIVVPVVTPRGFIGF